VALIYLRLTAAKIGFFGGVGGDVSEDVGVWTHCVGAGYDVVVSCNEHCNEPSCSMKGGEPGVSSRTVLLSVISPQILIPILGHVTKCTCAMYCVCVCGWG
jgi:hypothetical protein